MPYKWRAFLLVAVSLVGTFAELIPPMITRYIVDDVLILKEENVVGMPERLTLLGPLILGLVGV